MRFEEAVVKLLCLETDPLTVDPCRWEPVEVSNFIQIARMVTISDVTRRNRCPVSYFQKNLKKMLASVKDMVRAIEQFSLEVGETEVVEGDSRDLEASGIESESVDAIITSPPYSIALDYVENDEHALTALGHDTTEIRENFIGVRGRGKEKVSHYESDMKKVLGQMAYITRPGGHAVIVVGNVTLQGEESVTTDDMVGWAEAAGFVFDRELPKIVWGLYNLVKDEKILFFRKGL